jgi:hypothetical protein
MLNITLEQLNALTASEALQAMVDGLLENAADPMFRIDMGTFGRKNLEGLCFGCVATCTIAALNKKLVSETVKGLKPGRFHVYDLIKPSALHERLSEFEDAMDSVRLGDVWVLLEFVGATTQDEYAYDDRFCLTNDNWREELRRVELLIKELIEIGL